MERRACRRAHHASVAGERKAVSGDQCPDAVVRGNREIICAIADGVVAYTGDPVVVRISRGWQRARWSTRVAGLVARTDRFGSGLDTPIRDRSYRKMVDWPLPALESVAGGLKWHIASGEEKDDAGCEMFAN